MKLILQLLLIFLCALTCSANAQNTIERKSDNGSDSFQIQADRIFDSLKIEYQKYKKYEISRELIKNNWHKEKVGFNSSCDTMLFQGKGFDLPRFCPEIEKYLLSKSESDTSIFLLDYGDNVNIEIQMKSYAILANQIEKHTGHGMYYFDMYTLPREKERYVKSDTIDLRVNKIIAYNGEEIKFSELSNYILSNKPERLLLMADKELLIQDLVDVLQLAANLKIEIILVSKEKNKE